MMSDDLTTKPPRVWPFLPNGRPATRTMTFAYQSQDLEIDRDTRRIDVTGTNDSPEMEIFVGPNGVEFLIDMDSNEFLETHCRWLEVFEDFDPDEYEEPVIEAWPDDIIAACQRAACLQDTAQHVVMARRQMPRGFEDDTLKVVLKRFLDAKIAAMFGEAEMTIATFRKDRVEPTKFEEDEDV